MMTMQQKLNEFFIEKHKIT